MKHDFRIRNHPQYPGWYAVDVYEEGRHVGFLTLLNQCDKELVFWFDSLPRAQIAINEYQRKKKMNTATSSNTQLRGIIDTALNEMAGNQMMFTAFDVTRKIRKDNPSLHIYHDVVKQYVHDQYEGGSGIFGATYDRVLADFGDPQPWIYYIPGANDPKTYKASPAPDAAITIPPLNPKPTNNKGARVVVGTFSGFRTH
jgi:hypothetical protein